MKGEELLGIAIPPSQPDMCLIYEGGVQRENFFYLHSYILCTPLLIQFQACPHSPPQKLEVALVFMGLPLHRHSLANNPSSLGGYPQVLMALPGRRFGYCLS